MTIAIRAMTKEDWPHVAEIYQQGMDGNQATFQTKCPSYEEWDAAHHKICRFVAEENGEIVGWTTLMPYSSKAYYSGAAEVSLYIKDGHHRKGIGLALMNYQLTAAEQQGFWTITSLIMRDNQASVALHEKCGFRYIGYYERLGCDRFGRWRDVVLMEKRF